MLSMKQQWLLFLGCFLGEVAAQLCDTSPDALTLAFAKPIPQTCIQVPNEKDGLEERCFYSYLPKTCTSGKVPLVMDVHGMGSCPLYSAGYTGWMQKAEEECFMVVWPSGRENFLQPRCFNTPGFLDRKEVLKIDENANADAEDDDEDFATMPCCCLDDTTFLSADKAVDPLFLKMAIDHVVESMENDDSEEQVSIDTNRIYMAGHSNGCMMSLAMAALYSDTVAAVCCHAGSLTTPFAVDYSPVPIWMVHGMKDDVVPYNGRTMFPNWPGIGKKLGFLSMDETLTYLGDQNECLEQEEEEVSDEDGVIGTVYKRTNCEKNARVEVVALFEGGHNPYITPVMGESTTIDTTSMAWDFCSAQIKGPQPVLEVTSTANSSSNTTTTIGAEEGTVVVDDETELREDLFASSAAPRSSLGWLFVGAIIVNAL